MAEDRLHAYLSYLITESRRHSPKVLLKDNRFQFRLGWLRAQFPSAKVVHIYRRPEDQWQQPLRNLCREAGCQQS